MTGLGPITTARPAGTVMPPPEMAAEAAVPGAETPISRSAVAPPASVR
ncbi:MAG TPA: hypothetical protein VNW94_08730 [Streptosporangiaceae bacterium]|nr:hypothetical protein [Streptosporangiaceae bacterium]